MSKKTLFTLILALVSVFVIYRYNSEENKAARAKSAVTELLEEKNYTGKQIYDLAIEARKKENCYKTFYLLQAAADKGVECAEFELGRCYHIGKGTEKNQDQAIKWMTRAAEHGNPEYQYELGKYYDYLFGRDEENSQDMAKKAAKYYLRAARQGHPLAQRFVSQCYRLGRGVEKDLQEAEKWLLLAKQQGVNVDRQFAWLYIETKRPELAIPLLQKEALRGSVQAKRMLNEILKEISRKNENEGKSPRGVSYERLEDESETAK